jgi:hypothetical protein
MRKKPIQLHELNVCIKTNHLVVKSIKICLKNQLYQLVINRHIMH